jgi:hypothetical protein
MKFVILVFAAVSALVLALGGGSGYSQTVMVNRPVAEVYRAFAQNDDLGSLFGSMGEKSIKSKISREMADNSSIAYKIVAQEDKDGSIITLKFTPNETGGTAIEINTDVPEVKIADKPGFHVAENKVANAVKVAVEDIGKALESGNGVASKTSAFNDVIASVAVVTNPGLENDIRREVMTAFESSGDDSNDSSYAAAPAAAPVGITGKPSAPLPTDTADASSSDDSVPQFGSPEYTAYQNAQAANNN